MPETEPASV